jgi:predicted porin
MKERFSRMLSASPMGLVAAFGISTSAQAQSGNVAIYGLMDACLTSSDTGSGKTRGLNSGCLYGSRLGFRGTEDLGGGLRAYFTLESGLTIDNGQFGQGGRFFGRKAILGLGGAWGAIEMGRDYAPAFYVVQPTDPMALGIGTASSSIWTGAATTTVARNDNVINYLSPTWGGLSLRLQAGAGEDGNGSARKARGVNLLYRGSNAIAGLSHTRITNLAGVADDYATTAAFSYDFGAFSLAAIAQSGAWKGSFTAAAPSSAASIFSRDYRSYLIGGSMPVGAVGKINFSVKRYDDRTFQNYDLTQFSINYVYALSKRTDLYAGYSRAKNARQSTYAISDATNSYGGVSPGASPTLYVAGIKHVF